MEHIVIGIEGLVGAGKTSICRKLIQILPNTVLLNGGNLYRTIVYAIMKSGKDIKRLEQEMQQVDIKSFMDKFNITLQVENNETIIYIGNEKVEEEEIQSKDASMAVSVVGGMADNTKLFEFARGLIEQLKQNYNVIIAGRSIMQIYPNTDYHFFITASLEERVRRKCIQYKGEVDTKEVKNNILARDELQEKAGFYQLHPNTITIDVTECADVEASTKKVLDQIKQEQKIS